MTAAPPSFQFEPDAQSATPLYLQLASALTHAIQSGVYQVQDALPSERMLAESFGISRVTARKAIERLAQQGFIVRKHGSGNYIAPRLEQALTRLTSFTQELDRRGFVPQSRWLWRGLAVAQAEEKGPLGLRPAERVARLERLRLADGVVMAYEISVLPEAVLPDPEAVSVSLYAHLSKSGQAPVRARQHIRALNADARLASLLEVPVGAAVLFITRIGYQEGDKPMELTHSYCRADLYDFVADMRREP